MKQLLLLLIALVAITIPATASERNVTKMDMLVHVVFPDDKVVPENRREFEGVIPGKHHQDNLPWTDKHGVKTTCTIHFYERGGRVVLSCDRHKQTALVWSGEVTWEIFSDGTASRVINWFDVEQDRGKLRRIVKDHQQIVVLPEGNGLLRFPEADSASTNITKAVKLF